MPSSLLEGDDRQTVKRTVPKASNKIHAVALAKLYIAYPDRQKWTYTGLQGAAVLADDLVGNTFWIKLVDISPANRGVIWDQEIYDTFSYNQDRVFFHTFELEECLAGLSFADDKEAKQFKKKMDERERNAHKNTAKKLFGNTAAASSDNVSSTGKHRSRLGGLGSLLHVHRSSSAPHQGPMQSMIPPQGVAVASAPPQRPANPKSTLEKIDPALLDELLGLGLTEDQLADNADFIKGYIEQRKTTAPTQERRPHAPPPPPAPPSPQLAGTSLDSDGGSNSRRGPPPAPPPARRGATRSDSQRPSSPDSTAEDEPSPARAPAQPRFRAPPPLADAGKFAVDRPVPSSPSRAPASSTVVAHPGPPPPPRPPKQPLDDDDHHMSSSRFGVPPPFQGDRKPPPPPSRGSVPPPPPARGSVPPPPPARGGAPPTLPPKSPYAPPLPPSRDTRSVPPPPPMPDRSSGPPPPPPMPSFGGPPPPPPPPPGGFGGPPAPPPPPGMQAASANAPPLPAVGAGRGGLLADIRGGARLKKVSDKDKRDRSAAVISTSAGGNSSPAPPSASTPTAAAEGGLAGALASALAARKSKVSASDDEDDNEDW